MKYNMEAIDYREELMKGLSKAITEDAEKFAKEDNRNVVSADDMGKAFLICIAQIGNKIVENPGAFLE